MPQSAPASSGGTAAGVPVLPTAVVQGQAPGGAQIPQVVVQMPEDDGSKLSLCNVIAQGLRGTFKILHINRLTQCRAYFHQVTGGDPPRHERPSAEQWSAMHHLLQLRKGGHDSSTLCRLRHFLGPMASGR